jgi:hypothetical protein
MSRREAWGYVVWSAVGAVLAVPEIWALVGGAGVPWPTISGTIGHLEIEHDWVAFIVVGVIVWAGFHAVRVASSDVDRLTSAETTAPVAAWMYFPVALAATVAGSLLGDEYAADRYEFGEILYGLVFFWWIAVPGWLAYAHGRLVPYSSLFATLRNLERRLRPAAVLVASGLVILAIHLVLYPWPAVIPDLNRLHAYYRCAKQHARCPTLKPPEVVPSPYAP